MPTMPERPTTFPRAHIIEQIAADILALEHSRAPDRERRADLLVRELLRALYASMPTDAQRARERTALLDLVIAAYEGIRGI